MNEPFDAELSKAFKDSAKSLQGWEFTPQMRQKVLERVRAEEQASPASTERPARRSGPTTNLVRPLSWVAVAAAAAFLVMKIDVGGFGMGSSKSSDKMEVASAPMADQKAAPGAGIAAEDTSRMGIAAAKAPQEGHVIALTLPAELTIQKTAKDAAPPSLMAAQTSITLSNAVTGGPVVELNSRGARAVDPSGRQLWERPLAGVSERSLLAVAPSGHTAVTAGADLHILDAQGNIKHTVRLGGEPKDLAWSRDGLLAVSDEQAVNVYKDGAVQFTKSGPQGADVAFNAAGELAVYGAESGTMAVRLYDRAGQEVMAAKPAAEGSGLVATEAAVVAGAQAYSRQGQPIWGLSNRPEGIVAMDPTPLLVAWDAASVTAVDGADGQVRWRAVWDDIGLELKLAVPSADGLYVAILAGGESGGAVWVLDLSGQIILAEKLSAAPASAALSDGHLLLLMPGGIETRKLP